MKKASVIGCGSWGTALSLVLTRNGVDVAIWDGNSSVLDDIRTFSENKRYLPGFDLPNNAHVVETLAEAFEEAQLIVVAVPSQAIRSVMRRIVEEVSAEALTSYKGFWAIAAKGLEAETGLRLSQVALEAMPTLTADRLASLSGPNLAVEIAKGVPTATVAASVNKSAAVAVQDFFMCPSLRVYTNDDVVGVELGGALKNVLAIAAGMSDALGYGDNTKAALLARGLAEMTRIGTALGAKKDTFMGLTGVGDLFATAVSKLSRNYRAGFGLGQGKKLDDVLSELGQVAEGVATAHAVAIVVNQHDVSAPVFNVVKQVIDGEISPHDAVKALMLRSPKDES